MRMYCSACKVHHTPAAFGTQQRRKPATIRVCKTPIFNEYVYEDGKWRLKSGPRDKHDKHVIYLSCDDIDFGYHRMLERAEDNGNQRMLKRTKDNGLYVDTCFDRWEV